MQKESTTTSRNKDTATSQQNSKAEDGIAMLKADHRKVEKLFTQCLAEKTSTDQAKLAKQICIELIIHAKLEEEIFYRACRDAGVEESSLDEAQVEHDGAKVMIADILTGSPQDEFYAAKIKVLSEYIKHHIKEEEQPQTGVFAQAKKAKVDTAKLGERMQDLKGRLTAQKETLSKSPLEARSLHLQDIHTTQETTHMARNYQGNYNQNRSSREEDYGTGGRGYALRGRDDMSNRQNYGQDRQGSNRPQQSYSGDQNRGDHDRNPVYYGVSDRGRDADHHRYSYVTNEDYPDRSASRDMQNRDHDWDQDRYPGRGSQSSSRYSADENEDYSGSFRSDQGRNSQYDRGYQGSQYSQSNYGQNRNQGGYNQGNYGNQDRYSSSNSGGSQYGEDEDYGSRSGRTQQSQSRGQGWGQQTSQNRYRDDENHDQGYGASGSSSQRDWDDSDRFTRSTRRNPQYRD